MSKRMVVQVRFHCVKLVSVTAQKKVILKQVRNLATKSTAMMPPDNTAPGDGGTDTPPQSIRTLAEMGNAITTNFPDEDYVIVDADTNPRLPNGILVAMLMVVGLVGNSLVLYVYNFKMKRSVFSLFVTVLAVLDLCTVLCGMPIDVAIKSFLLPQTDAVTAICKLAHFENYGSSLTSGSVLLLIAVTRYRKVCQPLKPSTTLRSARMMCVIIFIIAMLLCSVTLVINGPETVKIAIGYTDVPVWNKTDLFPGTNNISSTMLASGIVALNTTISEANMTVRKKEVVEINICRTSEDQKQTALYYVLFSILFTAFLSIFISLIVLHCRISRSVQQFQIRQTSMRSHSIYSNDSNHTTDITTKMFRIFASVTVVFMVSYLPHLICLILERSLYKDGEPMSQAARIVMDLAYNSPYLNVILNPFIYGYQSAEFREHCIILFYRCCCWCCWLRTFR